MQKKIFISYTLRDNWVNKSKLCALKNAMLKFPTLTTYIDLLDNKNVISPQDEVVANLINSDILWVINSNGILESQWVSKEIDIAKQHHKDVYYISTDILENIINPANKTDLLRYVIYYI